MPSKRIKVFLGAFLNISNAQNINCLSLAKHLDVKKYKIYALSVANMPTVETKAILFTCFYPYRISIILGFIWGIIISDIIYLPKYHTTPKWLLIFCNFLGKKFFTTIENNMCDKDKMSVVNAFGGEDNLKNYFKHIPNIFGITKHIVDNANCGVKLKSDILYLGVEVNMFNNNHKNKLKNIVFVGNLTKRKRVQQFIELSNIFPDIQFNIIGDGIEINALRLVSGDNVKFFGHLDHNELSIKFNTMDLLFLPSVSEGFPKVILEAGASGIPSIVYSDYGANEWIDHSINGFLVNNFDDVIRVINQLLIDDKLLLKNSKGAYIMSCSYDWKKKIKLWERAIGKLE